MLRFTDLFIRSLVTLGAQDRCVVNQVALSCEEREEEEGPLSDVEPLESGQGMAFDN